MLDLTPQAAPEPAPASAPPETPLAAPEPTPPEQPPVAPEPVTPPSPVVAPDKPDVVLPPPRPRPAVKPPRAAAPPKPHPAPPPQAVAEAPPAVAAPPAPGPDAATWASRLAAHLLRFRHYPAEAERRGFTGVAIMRFSVDASGHVVSQSLQRSSGHDQLDQEAAAWLQRAQPLPAPPPDRAAPAQITVPLAFVLH
jgi:protein TonB